MRTPYARFRPGVAPAPKGLVVDPTRRCELRTDFPMCTCDVLPLVRARRMIAQGNKQLAVGRLHDAQP